jgi:ABC-2 type transport system permease protein
MRDLTGTLALVRFIVRRDRFVLLACVLAIAGLSLLSASSLRDMYPSAADRREFAASVHDNPALIAIRGPERALETPGGLAAFQIGGLMVAFAGLASLLLVGRHTRAEEERGRTELVRAAATGRFAPPTAALVVSGGVAVLNAVLIALGLIGLDYPTAGSVALGASFGAAGLVFAGVGALTAQIPESARPAYGMAAAVLGFAYVLRAAGDLGDGTLSWLSPIGWGQAMRPYADERWWPLLVALAATAALVVAAFVLLSRRDLGAGLVPPRPGPPRASPALGHPLGLAIRLQRGSVIGWSAGLFLLGLSYGSVGKNIEEFLDDNQAAGDLIGNVGGASLVDSYFVTTILFMALIGTGFAISSALRLRGEETSGRAEPVLSTGVERWRWASSHLAVALAGTVILLFSAGLGVGLAHGIRTGDLGEAPRLAGAALAQAPAVWIMAGIAAALFGLAPRAVPAAWGALAFCVLVGIAGPMLDFPDWVQELSPYHHAPELPAHSLAAGPVIGLTALAAAFTAVGVTAFRRRDVG